jgi:hypothetical protein
VRTAIVPALLCALAAAPRAQEQLLVAGPDPATVRLGDSARVEITIVDPGGGLRELRVPAVDGLRVRVNGPSQHTEQRWYGQTVTTRRTATWLLELQPAREGTFVLPPFPVWTGTREQETRELRLDVRKDMRGEELGWLEISVEPSRVYVHEPIRFKIAAGVHQGLRLIQERARNGQLYYDVEVQADWLVDFPAGEAIAAPPPSGSTALIVQGRMAIPVAVEPDHERGGERWLRFAYERSFLPTRIGTITLPAPLFRYHVLRKEGRQDIFGTTRGGVTEQYYAQGRPLTIEVLPIPEAGRPTPYYGAVGRFALEASLDRDQVKVGASVRLTLTVRGQGNLEFLRLPALDDLPGFHKLGQTEPRRDGEKVVVTYDLTPLSPEVREVPPIAWNWFDTTPGVEAFQTVRTPALPLRVLPLAEGETLLPAGAPAAKAVTPGVDDIFDLPALDGPPVVVRPLPSWAWAAALLGPWLLAVGWSLWRRHRAARAADPVGRRARAAAKACRSRLDRGEAPLEALAGYLGDRLGVPAAAVIAPDLSARLVAAGLDASAAAAVVAAIERGTAARYGGGEPFTAEAVRALVRDLEGRRFGVRAWLPLLVVMLGASAAAPLRAQDPVARGVQLYRDGDHAAAERAFAAAYAATGDRRLWQARGNCFFRQGNLPLALWAYENARRGRPRDAELLANLRLVRSRLELDDEPRGLLAQFDQLQARLLPSERLLLVTLCCAVAAGCLMFGWRRLGCRWLGVLALVPGALLVVPTLLGSDDRPRAVAVQRLQLVAEPRQGLEPVATVRPGVLLEVLGGSEGAYVRVRAGDRSGYAPREGVAVLE